MMKFLTTALLSLIFQLGMAQTPADKIAGEYWSPDKDAKILIYKAGNAYNGKLIWVKDTGKKDEKNPDANLRSRNLEGMEFIHGFAYNASDKEWQNAKIYDAQSGKTYSAKAWLNGKNLKLRGYLGISMLGRTEEFERIK